MTNIHLRRWTNPQPDDIAETVFQFLSQLGGPSLIELSGKDPSRCRVITTLLHGNEPSGLYALHRLLKEAFIPQTTTVFIVASVVAASTEPTFSHRMLEGQKDLNRCFGISDVGAEHTHLQHALAQAITRSISSLQAEAIIDIHNTSGSGPAFAVATNKSDANLALASHFTHRMIYTDIRLGAIMEQDFACPIITIEAGGAQDDEANTTAYNGLRSFLSADDAFEKRQSIEEFEQPQRLELCKNAEICYQSANNPKVDVTMRADIERLNFGKTEAGQHLGWARSLSNLCLDNTNNHVGEYFYTEQGLLKTKVALTLFMVTTRADIASSDCLFYFVPA
ncbi:succinylglutamate desuccinylase/aspartoacylase family protein [Ningiella sp. W23]|uniref:succinylglutamate desuccinylase/aspartoacylase domain-containing protein n=1 Tax=Ningiella sp. W23 TaxID=3023715 RepID=UPI003756DD89